MFNKTKKLKALEFWWSFDCSDVFVTQLLLLLSYFKKASLYEKFRVLFFPALSKGNPTDRWVFLALGGGECFYIQPE